MGKNTTSTNSSTTSANPQAAAAYSSLLGQAQGVAATPYQAYTGELTAPINSEQQTGVSGINAAAGQAQPAINQALGIAGNAANPLTAAQIQQYQNPYTQNVVDATQAQFNRNNQQQQEALTGNTIASGALGGNRAGIAANNLSSQQATAQNPVIAGLYANSYNSGLATAGQQFQQNPLAAAGSIANFGVSGQNAALTGAGAQLGAGTVEQQTQQATDTANQAAYAQQQAYPFQTAQWLAGIDTGVGSALGSSSTGTSTAPAPNQAAQYAGLGLAAASFLARGGRVGYADGGSVQHLGVGGTPWSNAPSWVPTFSGTHSAGLAAGRAPTAQTPTAPAFDYSKIISANNKDPNGLISGPSYGGGNAFTDEYGGSASSPLPGLDASDYGSMARGGGISGRRGYEDGGAPTDDPFGDDNRAIAYDLLRKREGIAAPDSIPGGEPPPSQGVGDAVWNPDEPYRLAGPEAMDAWRKGNPIPPLGTSPAAPSDDDEELPPEITKGTTRPPNGVAGPSDDGTALGYAGPPTTNPAGAYVAPISQPSATPSGGLPNAGILGLSSNARSGLLAAGLGMLASRSSNFGNAIGEGGLHGLAAYSAANEHDQKVADEAAKLSREAQQHAEEMKFKTAGQNETIRHNKATEETAADKTKFTPLGSVITADGSVHPLVLDQYSGKSIDSVTGKPPNAADKTTGKNEKPVVSDEDAKAVAQRYVRTGDRTQLQGLGVSGAARQKVNHYIGEVQKEEGVSDQDLGTRVAEWEGRKAGQRVLGTQEAKMGSAAFEAEGAMKLARGTIDKVPRTSYLPLNKLIQGYQSQTLNPDQAELYARAQAIVNTYSAVMARGANITTDASRGHAEALLNTAGDHDTWNRTLDTLQSEIDMAKGSPEKMREFYRKQFGAKAIAPDTAPPGAVAAPAAGTSAAPPAAKPPAGAVSQRPDRSGVMHYFDANGTMLQ